jgi:hypothetical protein
VNLYVVRRSTHAISLDRGICRALSKINAKPKSYWPYQEVSASPSCTIVASDAFAVPAAATEEISGLAAGVDPGQTGAAKGG